MEVDFTSEEWEQTVHALERNPANVDDLFNRFRVEPYLCGDDNEFPLNEPYDVSLPDPANIADEFLVGENFRICVKPLDDDPNFGNFEITAFNNVICEGIPVVVTDLPAQSRLVIANGAPAPSEVELTNVFYAPPVVSDRQAKPREIAFESVVTSGFAEDGKFLCHGTVELAPKSSRRMLQDGRSLQDGVNPNAVTGAFTVQLTVVKPGLSTGAIIGISVAVAVVFFLVVFILYRRGCFAKRKTGRDKPPKTVSIDENSETTGDVDENA